MSNACDTCGYRSSDIKAGGGISEKGSNIILNVAEQDDLKRDVIKAESASISIPEADLEVTTGAAQASGSSVLMHLSASGRGLALQLSRAVSCSQLAPNGHCP